MDRPPAPARSRTALPSASSRAYICDVATLATAYIAGDLSSSVQTPLCRRITWLQLDAHGGRRLFAHDKRALCVRKGLRLPVSDLRVLDPAYASPRRGCILARDKCIVICLEHVRVIVMRDCALVPLERGAAAAPLQAAAVAALERAAAGYAAPASEAADLPGALAPCSGLCRRLIRAQCCD